MLAPEYRVGFRVLREKIGLWATLSLAIPAFFKALMDRYIVEEVSDKVEMAKADLKKSISTLVSVPSNVTIGWLEAILVIC